MSEEKSIIRSVAEFGLEQMAKRFLGDVYDEWQGRYSAEKVEKSLKGTAAAGYRAFADTIESRVGIPADITSKSIADEDCFDEAVTELICGGHPNRHACFDFCVRMWKGQYPLLSQTDLDLGWEEFTKIILLSLAGSEDLRRFGDLKARLSKNPRYLPVPYSGPEDFVGKRCKGTVLIIDDEVMEVEWLVDMMNFMGYAVDLAANETAGKRALVNACNRRNCYELAIVDIMLPECELEELLLVESEFFERSKDAGLRLCRFARETLGLSASDLPIICHSARADEPEIVGVMKELGVPCFLRHAYHGDGLRDYLKETLKA